MVGKLGISGAFSSIYLMTGELFPTNIRNCGLGCSSNAGRVGSAVSPYIVDLVCTLQGGEHSVEKKEKIQSEDKSIYENISIQKKCLPIFF
jgi:hypothetical protein